MIVVDDVEVDVDVDIDDDVLQLRLAKLPGASLPLTSDPTPVVLPVCISI